MLQLPPRQSQILAFIQSKKTASNAEIVAHLTEHHQSVSRITVLRDLEILHQNGLILQEGKGRSTKYRPKITNPLLVLVSPDHYFQTEADIRNGATGFDFSIYTFFEKPFFTEKELNKLNLLTQKYQRNLTQLSPFSHQRELERLTIELSWKSSQIEGNTYSLLDTEALIKENIEAVGHSHEEATMILNHKKAIDAILHEATLFNPLSLRRIEDLHRILMTDLHVPLGLREGLVRIIGTTYTPLDNHHQLKENLEKTIQVINTYTDPFHKAATAIALISYLQPFADGNKRTARLTGNALLYAQNACPLSYRSVHPTDYKKALILFYEQRSLVYFKTLFIEQYAFSVENYFVV
jgi:Fic family protein